MAEGAEILICLLSGHWLNSPTCLILGHPTPSCPKSIWPALSGQVHVGGHASPFKQGCANQTLEWHANTIIVLIYQSSLPRGYRDEYHGKQNRPLHCNLSFC